MSAGQAHDSDPKPDHHYIGVRQRSWGRFTAEIRSGMKKRRLWLGTYDTDVEAALAYDRAARALRGAAAKINFPHLYPEIEAPPIRKYSFHARKITRKTATPWTHSFLRKPSNVPNAGLESDSSSSSAVTDTECLETKTKRNMLNLDLNLSPPVEENEDARPDADHPKKTLWLLGSI